MKVETQFSAQIHDSISSTRSRPTASCLRRTFPKESIFNIYLTPNPDKPKMQRRLTINKDLGFELKMFRKYQPIFLHQGFKREPSTCWMIFDSKSIFSLPLDSWFGKRAKTPVYLDTPCWWNSDFSKWIGSISSIKLSTLKDSDKKISFLKFCWNSTTGKEQARAHNFDKHRHCRSRLFNITESSLLQSSPSAGFHWKRTFWKLINLKTVWRKELDPLKTPRLENSEKIFLLSTFKSFVLFRAQYFSTYKTEFSDFYQNFMAKIQSIMDCFLFLKKWADFGLVDHTFFTRGVFSHG